ANALYAVLQELPQHQRARDYYDRVRIELLRERTVRSLAPDRLRGITPPPIAPELPGGPAVAPAATPPPVAVATPPAPPPRPPLVSATPAPSAARVTPVARDEEEVPAPTGTKAWWNSRPRFGAPVARAAP